MPERWSQAEYERRLASWEEDVRILTAQLDDARADAAMLRERGHDFPAEVMEQAIHKAEAMIADARAKLEDDGA